MENLHKRIITLLEVFDHWLSDENKYLNRSIARTVDEGYFSFHDCKYALNALKENLNETALREWIDRSGIRDSRDASGRNCLCLHAGNLPLVGLQDALAVLISGARYSGKISRKDPYLLPTFLNEIKNTGVWSSRDVQWSHRLDDFEDMQNDDILFSGSETSVPAVMGAVKNYNLKKSDTRFLIRTAHFSMAYLENRRKKNMEELVEAVFRYGGRGCRSVAVVISPFKLNSIKCELTDYIESFWLNNPQHAKPKPKLKQRFAYNKAVERPQAWLDDFMLQEGGLELDQDFICYWVQGDEKTVSQLAEEFGNQLQNIYVTHPDISIPGKKEQTEFLSDAQTPPVYWKPDGKDVLKWLIKN